MVATPLIISPPSSSPSLDEFLLHPSENCEWIDGRIIEKHPMTLRHSRIQSQIATYWNNHATATNQGGRALTEAPCRTQNQGRRPDVAYLPQALYQQYGQVASLPQSFPLIAEIASPDDRAEDLFAKADEYLDSGCDEVWIVFPEACFILVKARTNQGHIGQWQALGLGQTIATQHGLPGFQCQVDDLLN